MSPDEYRELLEDARDSLAALLSAVEPHEALRLRLGYRDICAALELFKQSDTEDAAPARDGREERDTARTAWLELPRPEKRHRLLNALGDNRLVGRELLEQLRSTNEDCLIYESDVKGLTREMVASGELDRAMEARIPGTKTYRWRYHRRVTLSPELRALERALAACKDEPQ